MSLARRGRSVGAKIPLNQSQISPRPYVPSHGERFNGFRALQDKEIQGILHNPPFDGGAVGAYRRQDILSVWRKGSMRCGVF